MNSRFFASLVRSLAALVAGILLQTSLSAATQERKSVRYAIDLRLKSRHPSIQNGVLVVYSSKAAEGQDQGIDQIELFRLDGFRIFSLNVLKAVPEAIGASIWDVAVSPQGRVAVSAVFVTGARVSATLLLYGADGKLANAVYLPRERFAVRLAFDDQEYLWALGKHSGNKDPGLVPLIYKYDYTGKPVAQFIPRSEFLQDARNVGPTPGKGDPGFGVTDTEVWVWLPNSRKLLTIRKDGTGLKTFDVDDPPWPVATGPVGPPVNVVIHSVFLIPPGKLVAKVNFSDQKIYTGNIYEWSAASRSWKALPLPEGSFLVGVTDEDVIVATPDAAYVELVWFPRH